MGTSDLKFDSNHEVVVKNAKKSRSDLPATAVWSSPQWKRYFNKAP